MTSKSRSGKTNISISLCPFSYFNSMWNLLNYSYNNPINIMDDYKGTIDTDEFAKIKPWVGSQYSFTVCDKYQPKLNVVNGKPLIWLSNKPFEKQVLDEEDRDYVKKNMTIIELGEHDLYSSKDRRTIGGYTSWVNWDPKSTWYYKNIILNLEKNKEPETSQILNEDDASTSTAQLLKDDNADIIEISDEEPNDEDIPPPGSNIKGRPIRKLISEIFETNPRNKRRRIQHE